MVIVHARPAALLFDVDGTLADTEGSGHLPAFNAAFSDCGLPLCWDRDHYRHLLASVPGGRERIYHELMRLAEPSQAGTPDGSPQSAAQPSTIPRSEAEAERLAQQLHRQKNRHYAALLERGAIRPRPGVIRLLTEAHHAGTPIAIVTTSARANVDALFGTVLPEWVRTAVSTTISGDDVAVKKPHPEAYRKALNELGLPADVCTAFEDSANGLVAASAAGIPTVVTRNEWTRDDDFSGAMAVVDDLDHDAAGQPITLAWLRRAILNPDFSLHQRL